MDSAEELPKVLAEYEGKDPKTNYKDTK